MSGLKEHLDRQFPGWSASVALSRAKELVVLMRRAALPLRFVASSFPPRRVDHVEVAGRMKGLIGARS